MSKNFDIRSKNASVKFISSEDVQSNINQSSAKGRPKSTNETKGRKTVSVYPSLWAEAQKIAYVERTDISNLIGDFLTDYVEKNADKIEEYKKLKGE